MASTAFSLNIPQDTADDGSLPNKRQQDPVIPPDSGLLSAVEETCVAVGSHYRRKLLDALSGIEGHKLLLLEESLAAAVSCLVDAAALQQHGVERCFALGAFPLSVSSVPSQTALAPTVLFLCRPRLSRLPLIIRHMAQIEGSFPQAQAPASAHAESSNCPPAAEEALWSFPLPPATSKSGRRYVVAFIPNPSEFLAGELRRLLSSSTAQQSAAEDSASSSSSSSSLIPAAAASLISNISSTLLPLGSTPSTTATSHASLRSVSSDCVLVTHCPLRLFPVEKDLLSLEIPNFFRAFHGQGDPTLCKQVADTVVSLQEELQQGVLIPNLRCIGSAAKSVADFLIRRRREQQQQRLQLEEASLGVAAAGTGLPADLVPPVHSVLDVTDLEGPPTAQANGPQGAPGAIGAPALGMGPPRGPPGRPVMPHKADMLVVFDRRADLVTPLCTTFTYEGLLDSMLGMDGSGIEASASEASFSSGGVERDLVMIEPARRQRVSLVGDSLYAALKNLHQSEVGGALHRVASDIQQTYREKESLRTIADISSFMPKFKAKQQEHSSLSLHVKLASFVSAVAKHPAYHHRLCIEDQILQGGGTGPSGTFGACSVEMFEAVVQQHGLPELRRIAALHKVGLLREQQAQRSGKAAASGMGLQRWKLIKDKCRLMVEEDQAARDIAYACSGYAPLSIRLLQLLHESPLGWRAIPDILNSLWGPAMEIRQQQPLPKVPQQQQQQQQHRGGEGKASAGALAASNTSSHTSGPLVPPGPSAVAPVLILMLFLGGVSHSEIAAVRRLNEIERKGGVKSEQPEGYRQYLILTTEILTPRKLFKGMINDVD
ncbi:sec1 family domain-containing protein [Cyclospora cayetanensis]|uniref:Sec1 family domain-containing protein n=1 Tax=Cyclospora cayetanensis TaxID=88456 RepID=A0A1D3CXH4_9EIME|nr:sec1 family domain-containing protein [Cyclospora cayetanensis]